MKPHWIVLALVLAIGLLTMACVANTPVSDLKAKPVVKNITPYTEPMTCEDYRLHYQKWAMNSSDIWTLHGDNVSLDGILVEYVGWEEAQNLTINKRSNWNHPARLTGVGKDGRQILNISLPEEMKVTFQDKASGKIYVVKLFQLVENFAWGSGAYAEMDIEREGENSGNELQTADCDSYGNNDWTTGGFGVKEYNYDERQMRFWPADCKITELDISSNGERFAARFLYNNTKTNFIGPDNKTYEIAYCGQNRVRITPAG